MPKTSTVEEILEVLDQRKTVDVPGIGVVTIQALSYLKHIAMRRECMRKIPGKSTEELDVARYQPLLIQECVVEPQLTLEQATAICNGPVLAVVGLINAIDDVNGATARGVPGETLDEAEAAFRE